MFDKLPTSYDAVKGWTWDDFAPFYQDLLERDLTPETLNQWMQDRSDFSALINETFARLSVAKSQDTSDAQAEQDFNFFLQNVLPHSIPANNEVNKKLVASGLEPDNFEIPLKKMRNQIEIFREANIPLIVEERKLANEYDRLAGAQTVEWEGEEVTLPAIEAKLEADDREVRQQVWTKMMGRSLQDREDLNELWIKLFDLRTQMAANAGEPNYRDFSWKARNRFDYTPEDCTTFHDAIEQVFVPAAERIYQKRKENLGVDVLRPWDLDVDEHDLAGLVPFQKPEEFDAKASTIFHKVDPKLGGYFDEMRAKNLLDLLNRKGKAPGGYCTRFAIERVPFIFMNAVGIHKDVRTLVHEAGHAFHGFEVAKLPYLDQHMYPIEFAEVASMAMELLSAPYWAEYYPDEKDYKRAVAAQLKKTVLFFPYMAVVDAFQQWAYTHPDDAKDPLANDVKWNELWDRFMKGVDWSGYEDAKVTGWHRKLHIFRIPFYYVEYGLAQLGALQVWANAQRDQALAVQQYRSALALGGTRSIPELFETAGAKFIFDAASIQPIVDMMEDQLDMLEG